MWWFDSINFVRILLCALLAFLKRSIACLLSSIYSEMMHPLHFLDHYGLWQFRWQVNSLNLNFCVQEITKLPTSVLWDLPSRSLPNNRSVYKKGWFGLVCFTIFIFILVYKLYPLTQPEIQHLCWWRTCISASCKLLLHLQGLGSFHTKTIF